ncbi:MAG: Cob(I)alamin adenosyltransferase [Candidatus Uhrbacteria bacterium GW2011_GWA2_52_8d]|uniref:Cob(I)alamin adenosyltransferase n=1 Tax=Candidatus Uhrbacteria bacterium GW2011_GWA2_52_8d TaxID=1618979 RepID=A0A0G1XKB9_9BACT|nr:MAG: Cob(I)alamin adenosyltransferase [Candidatus Uhrbacteria bacterium GW2011_GWA2_52_8d]
MEKYFVSNKAILVDTRGKILMMSLPDGRWDLPGGRMDAGETMLEGLAREVCEETGIEIDSQKARPFFVGVYPYKGDPPVPVASVFYIVQVVEGLEITLSSEHAAFEWIDPRQTLTGEGAHGPILEILEAYRQHEGIVVAADESIKGREGFGLIQLFTGNGKGKTTAALGEVLRVVGAGKRAAVIFFDKGGEHYMERMVLEKLGVLWFAFGRDRIDPVTGRFDFTITEEDRRLGREGLSKAINYVRSDIIDLLVLDEINSSTDLGIIMEQDVLEFLDTQPEHTEIVLTGRNAPQSFIDRAHLVTEMRLRKHYFYSGVKAREGLDY